MSSAAESGVAERPEGEEVTATVKGFGGWAVSRSGIFVVEMLYLFALWVVAILFFTHTLHPRHTVGNMPIAVPWFGALGAVLLSLIGVFEYRLDWQPGYAQWHWARPFVGASFAVVSVMIMQAGILSIGSDPHNTGSSSALYFIVGFVVGYREETFRELIKRLVDVILQPAPQTGPSSPTISSLTPPGGPSAGGTQVTIDGSGFEKVLTIKFGDREATAVTTDSASRIEATAPPAGQAGKVTVVVTTVAGAATAAFTYQ